MKNSYRSLICRNLYGHCFIVLFRPALILLGKYKQQSVPLHYQRPTTEGLQIYGSKSRVPFEGAVMFRSGIIYDVFMYTRPTTSGSAQWAIVSAFTSGSACLDVWSAAFLVPFQARLQNLQKHSRWGLQIMFTQASRSPQGNASDALVFRDIRYSTVQRVPQVS